MEYLKVWTSFREAIVVLEDDEKGRLFDAMLLYADSGEEPSEFKGNEKFLWPVAKQDIDRTAQKCEALRRNGQAGGLQKARNQALANDSKAYQTVANDSKSQQTLAEDAESKQDVANVSHNIKKSNVKKSNERDILFDRFWAAYPRHDTKAEARKVFDKLKPDEDLLAVMLAAIEQQKKGNQWADPRYIPQPRTWLNQRRWEDETPVSQPKPAQPKKVVAQDYEQREYGGEDNLADVLSILQGDMRA